VRSGNVHEAAAARLTALDHRYTRGRHALIDVLLLSDAPLTIAEILDRESTLALSTTYRNLAVLEAAGLVHRIATSDEHARYELDETLTERHHHHLVCSSCGTVRDFTIAEQLEVDLERALDRVARTNEFEVQHHRLDLVGLCPVCC
jgi:Fur family ferric uptake transcriptional regulator